MFNQPFSFEGRIRRTEYGISFIIYFIISAILNVFIAASGDAAFFFLLLYIPILWFIWAQGAKRCHDLGNSGWWQLIPFYTLWLLFQDGQPGANQYGRNPKNSNKDIMSQASPSGYPQGIYSGGHNGGGENNNLYHNNKASDNRSGSGSEYKEGNLYN